jgi:inhibitor of KinA
MTLSPHFPRLLNVGLSGVLVTFSSHLNEAGNRAALSFRACVDAANIWGVLETSTSLTSTFVCFDLALISNHNLRQRLLALLAQQNWEAAKLPTQRRLWRIPTVFGGENGPQLAEVADVACLSVAAAIAMIEATPVRVLTIGFAPGQPYIGVLPERWDVPRQSVLTASVPEGALVTAIRQLIVFTAATPTGWRHIGQTAFRGFRPESETPFALRPGDELQFVAINAIELDQIRMRDTSGNGGAEILNIL